MKYFRVPLLILLCVGLFAYALRVPTYVSPSHYPGAFEVDVGELERHVRVLSEDLTPRTCENPGELRHAANYVRAEFLKWNADTHFQSYDVDGNSFSNVLSSYGPDTDQIVIVGGHYDAYAQLPGADDNASGIAGLLELGRGLSTASLNTRVLLIAYACEEPPYFAGSGMGSYVHANSIHDNDVILMISLEMIGYFTEQANSQEFPVPLLSFLYPDQGDFIAVVGKLFDNEASRLKSTLNRYTDISAYSINAPTAVPGLDFSDHRNYWALNFPAIMVTDTAFFRNKNYHTLEDTYDTLDYAKMKEVVFGVYVHVVELANTF